jgi:NADH-quinone oxidoreductase subunit N
VPKLAIFILIIRIFDLSFFEYTVIWQYYIVILAILTIIVVSFAGLEQKKLKSLLAYSSISHMGYI